MFSAYTSDDLLLILQSRLESLGPIETRNQIINPTALNFLCKKAAAQNGDVRFAMSVLRRCLDSAEKETTLAKTVRVDMKHVLESVRAHESGSLSTAKDTFTKPSQPSADASGSNSSRPVAASKGSGVSRTVRGLGLHARLALIAIIIGWKRLEASLPLGTQSSTAAAISMKSPSKSRSPTKRSVSTPMISSNPNSVEGITPSSLHAFYIHLLTAQSISADGESTRATPFNPVSRSEFQDVLGVLEAGGLVEYSSTSPITINTSSSSPTLSSSSSIKDVMKTPSKPKRTVSTMSLPTPSRSGRGSFGGKGKAVSGEPFVVLQGGVREEEVVRGLVTATTLSASDGGNAGALEREIERLLERENRKIGKDVDARRRKREEADELMRRQREAIPDDGFGHAFEEE